MGGGKHHKPFPAGAVAVCSYLFVNHLHVGESGPGLGLMGGNSRKRENRTPYTNTVINIPHNPPAVSQPIDTHTDRLWALCGRIRKRSQRTQAQEIIQTTLPYASAPSPRKRTQSVDLLVFVFFVAFHRFDVLFYANEPHTVTWE